MSVHRGGTVSARRTQRWRTRWRGAVRRTTPRDFLRLAGVLTLLAGVAVGARAAGLRVPLTASLPWGVYREVGGSPERGAIALWCLPEQTARWARARAYLGRGSCPGAVAQLGKIVLAAAGDTVRFGADGVVVNGVAVSGTRPLSRDAAGRRLPRAPFGTYVLRRDQAWLWSPYTSRSFDSRYFGPVATTSLVAVVRPVWTWR